MVIFHSYVELPEGTKESISHVFFFVWFFDPFPMNSSWWYYWCWRLWFSDDLRFRITHLLSFTMSDIIDWVHLRLGNKPVPIESLSDIVSINTGDRWRSRPWWLDDWHWGIGRFVSTIISMAMTKWNRWRLKVPTIYVLPIFLGLCQRISPQNMA